MFWLAIGVAAVGYFVGLGIDEGLSKIADAIDRWSDGQ